MDIVLASTSLLVLLNPFLLIVYLIEIVQKLDFRTFTLVLLRAGSISAIVFILFAILGDAIFADVVQAEFASFQIFGGIIFLMIGIQFVFKGRLAIEALKGKNKYVSGAVAMPILIGPGSISYSVIIGEKFSHLQSTLAVLFALVVTIGILIGLKKFHDEIHYKKEAMVQRYFEIAGRITAMFVGTISIEMIMSGLAVWINKVQ
ncbi:MAG: MarC family protein [Bacteroidetes bacterium]|nr:MarC family protein [Bacteroidota bacterium]